MTPCLTRDNKDPGGATDIKDKRKNWERKFIKSFQKEVTFCFVSK